MVRSFVPPPLPPAGGSTPTAPTRRVASLPSPSVAAGRPDRSRVRDGEAGAAGPGRPDPGRSVRGRPDRGGGLRCHYSAAVDIEGFYDADERRRSSAEVELGREWRDGHGVRYELNWVVDTGELYVMREPVPPEWEDPFGGVHVKVRGLEDPVKGMTVRVIGHVDTHDRLEQVMAGWQDAMADEDSIGWLVGRLRSSGVALPAEAPEPEG